MNNKNVIEINGKQYDAVTGRLLEHHHGVTHHPKTTHGGAMDAVVVKPQTASKQHASHATATKHHQLQPASSIQHITPPKSQHSHQAAPAKAAHAPQRAKTLKREAVSKPAPAKSAVRRVQAPAGSLPAATVKHSPSMQAMPNEQRLLRAREVRRSHTIQHFPKQTTTDVQVMSAAKKPATAKSPAARTSAKRPSPATTAVQDVVVRGLAKAESHKEPAPKVKKHRRRGSSKRRRLGWLGAALLVLIIISFLGYKNIPNIDVHIASARAGMHAELPSYQPSGFKFVSPVKYGQGIVAVSFRSGSKSFRVTQRLSDWDSVSLRDNFVESVHAPYKVLQAKGRTVYIYGQNDATWVNAGVWYQIADNAQLSTTELLNIATSM